MVVTAQFERIKGAQLPAPQFETAGPVTRHLDGKGYYVAIGVSANLMSAAKDAMRAMIEHLGKTYGLTPEDAYLLCRVACGRRISEIVDMPNGVVSFHLPLQIFFLTLNRRRGLSECSPCFNHKHLRIFHH